MATCPYCKRYFRTNGLAYDHMNKIHAKQLEEDHMDAPQSLYYSTHGTLEGTCVCGCGRKTEWNYKTGKPYRLSKDPSCRERMRTIALENHRRVFGKDTLLDDMNHQKEMQHNRPTAGTYSFPDGGKIYYLSSLEKSFLQFCDIVMEFTSNMITESPEVFTYVDRETKKTRQYIPDFYLPDYNLLVEIKDGGKHPNGNPAFQRETKYKVKYKDDVMRKQKRYNFIKIVDREYGPFVELLYKITHDDEKKTSTSPKIVITESACLDPDQKVDLMHNYDKVSSLFLLLGVGKDSLDQTIYGYGVMSDPYQDSCYWYNRLTSTISVESLDDIIEQYMIQFYKLDKIYPELNYCYQVIENISKSDNTRSPLYDILLILQKNGLYFTTPAISNDPEINRMDFILLNGNIGEAISTVQYQQIKSNSKVKVTKRIIDKQETEEYDSFLTDDEEDTMTTSQEDLFSDEDDFYFSDEDQLLMDQENIPNGEVNQKQLLKESNTVVDDQGTSSTGEAEPWFRRIDQRGGEDSDHEFYPNTELGPNDEKDTTDFTRSYSIL